MKRITALTLLFFVFLGCAASVRNEISNFKQQLGVVQTAVEEKEILENLWGISNENGEINMEVMAIDSTGNSVINNLSEALEPITVTITFHAETWEEIIKFEPLDIENVYLLLKE